MISNQTKRLAILLLILIFSKLALAQTGSIIAIPSTWRLENYVSDNVVLWYTGSTCANGLMKLPVSASKADRDRLWVTVSLGKSSDKKVFIIYYPQSTTCEIISFGLMED
jgi:hypothetical protein